MHNVQKSVVKKSFTTRTRRGGGFDVVDLGTLGGVMMAAYILYGLGAFCCLGAFSERKDLMRTLSFLAVAAIFGLLGLAFTSH